MCVQTNKIEMHVNKTKITHALYVYLVSELRQPYCWKYKHKKNISR